MITSIANRANIGKVIALGFLLAPLLAMVLSAAPPAGAAVSSGKAFSWGSNADGQLGNGTSGDGTDSDVPVAVKNLTTVKNIDGGPYFVLAATQ
jgi:regulator of chromosome condensation (RCC1) repeat-containing protein